MSLNKHKKKINKLLRKKVTVGRAILVSSGVLLAALFTLGAASPDSPQYVARTGSLNPTPIVSQSPEVIVKTTIEEVKETAKPNPVPTVAGSQLGYAGMGGQCTDYIRMVAPGLAQNGNAGSWKANSSVPSVGSVMIWRPGQMGASSAGHVALVVGINGGSITVRHWNWPGQTTFSSTGNFYK